MDRPTQLMAVLLTINDRAAAGRQARVGAMLHLRAYCYGITWRVERNPLVLPKVSDAEAAGEWIARPWSG
jgi:hypothetical protein